MSYLIVTGDFKRQGGMDRPNFELARHLAARGDEVHLVAHHVDPGLAAAPNVRVHHVPRPGNAGILGVPLLDVAGRFWGRRCRRVVVNGGNAGCPDVSWVHYVHAAYEPRTSEQPLRQAKNLVAHQLALRMEASVLRRARLVIANSGRTRDDLVARLGVPKERIEVVYYGIDPADFRPASPEERSATRRANGWPDDRPIALFVGALGDRRKGFDTLFEAWRRLCADSAWAATLVVLGAGAELPRWRQRAADAGLAAQLQFLGFRTDAHALIRAGDLLVAPTRYEAYGQGVHEALCCGLPAIVTRDAGVAERYPESLAELLLDDPNDTDELERRLRGWASHRDDLREAVAPLAEELRAYRWEEMAARITAAIERCGPGTS